MTFLARHWQYAAMGLLALALAGQTWRLDREQAAHTATEARWQVAQAEAARLATEKAHRQQQAVDQAEAADVQERIVIREKLVPIREEIIRYVQTQPDGVNCVDPVTRGLLSEAIRAANSATTAGGAATGR